MAPMFEVSDEIIDMIKVLFAEREDLFADMKEFVFPEMFAAGLRTDKQAPAKQKSTLKVEGIKGSKTILTDKKWLISGFKDKWDSCSKEKKFAIVANMLRRVAYPTKDEINKLAEKGQDYEYGKLVKPDIEDFSMFLKTFGVNWNDQSVLPNISTDKSIEV